MACESRKRATAAFSGSSPPASGTSARSAAEKSSKKKLQSKTLPAPIETFQSTWHFVQSGVFQSDFPVVFSRFYPENFLGTFCASGSSDEHERHGNTIRDNKRASVLRCSSRSRASCHNVLQRSQQRRHTYPNTAADSAPSSITAHYRHQYQRQRSRFATSGARGCGR